MKKIFIFIFAVSFLLTSCNNTKTLVKLVVTNPSDFDRDEVVQLDASQYDLKTGNIFLINQTTNDTLLIQQEDTDNNGVIDILYFKLNLKPNENITLSLLEGVSKEYTGQVKTFGRFVPERTDDFTWENDKVAFRVYGPTAQKMVEDGVKGGTLSGGVDCWLKKVDYSIIDKWYKGNTEKPGYYHKDHGEGLDNYHVGPSLGCGGTGVMVDDELLRSQNYTAYEVFENGPLKTTFNLNYAPYGNENVMVVEKKQVSIKLGDNLSKFVIEVEGTDTLTTGITLHDKLGEISVDSTAVWADYWAPLEGEEIGNAIVVEPKYFAGFTHVDSDVKDKSHILVHLKVIDGKVEYYSGFGWSGSKQFAGKQQWEEYLTQFAGKIQQPIEVEVLQK